ncbi:MAG: hypothetical protein WAK06_11830, partial [Glutamicibacter protophormiae]
GYVVTGADFANGKDNAALSLSGSNGLFAYGPGSRPSNSWNNSNYFADLLYSVNQAPAARKAEDGSAPAKQDSGTPAESTVPETTKPSGTAPPSGTDQPSETATPTADAGETPTPTPSDTDNAAQQPSRPPEASKQ